MKLTPYREIAKRALISWSGISEEEATKLVLSQSFEELENQCWATSSIMAALNKTKRILKLSEEKNKELIESVLAKDHAEMNKKDKVVFSDINKDWKQNVKNSPKAIIEILSAVHDDWVKNNAKKFNKEGRENKRYQHLPVELIGWKEAKLDLLFVKPILEAIDVKATNHELAYTYDKRVIKFFEYYELKSKDDIKDFILNIDKYYSPVTEQNTTKDERVAEEMANQVMDRCIFDKTNEEKKEMRKGDEE